MKKVSILIPTYNDEKYICRTLDSILKQSYSNYEILICNDGSTDNSENIIKKYKKEFDKDNKIKYFYQENADQLNAIITLLPYITGDYVYILHSDDLLYDNNTLSKMVEYMDCNEDISSIIGNYATIDGDDNVTGMINVNDCRGKTNDIIALQLLWLGRNLYVDMAFHRRDTFLNEVYNNYLVWNGPFWLNIDNDSIVNFRKVDFPFFKYRLGDNNYLNTIGSKLNVINGEIRVITRLFNNYYIPLYKLQYYVYRVFNKIKLTKYFKVFYLKKETYSKYKIVKFVLNKRFNDDEINDNMFLRSLLLYYKNYQNRKIYLSIDNSMIYLGKDMRLFNKKIVNNSIEDIYVKIMKEMEKGFNEIIVKKGDYDSVIQITKFLCIYPYVKVTISNEEE